jgi:hypothetical protein
MEAKAKSDGDRIRACALKEELILKIIRINRRRPLGYSAFHMCYGRKQKVYDAVYPDRTGDLPIFSRTRHQLRQLGLLMFSH